MTTPNVRSGVSVGRYRIARRLGAGGMAEVFLAHDPRLNRDVAIKVLGGDLVEQSRYRLFLEREARAVARLNHPNVAQVFDVLEFQGHACFVMEYLEGESLAERLRRGALTLHDTVRLGAQIAAGVAHAHAHGVLHCDLKPGNVFITTEGVAKVLDFGLARPSGQGADGVLTDIGASPTLIANRAGTPAYMPPELYLGQPLNESSDIYSLGLVLVEMVTGRKPPRPRTPMVAMPNDTTREQQIDDHDVPSELRPIVRKALAPLPTDRFHSALEMTAALESVGLRTVTATFEPDQPAVLPARSQALARRSGRPRPRSSRARPSSPSLASSIQRR